MRLNISRTDDGALVKKRSTFVLMAWIKFKWPGCSSGSPATVTFAHPAPGCGWFGVSHGQRSVRNGFVTGWPWPGQFAVVLVRTSCGQSTSDRASTGGSLAGVRASRRSGVGCGLCVARTGACLISIPSNDRTLKDSKTIRLFHRLAFPCLRPDMRSGFNGRHLAVTMPARGCDSTRSIASG